MPVLREDFIEFVRKRMGELNLDSPYAVDRKSGGRVSHATVWNILNQQVKEIKDETVDALAVALEINPDEMHRRARGIVNTPERADELRVLDFLKAMPESVRSDAVAILETLWRRHSADSNAQAKLPGFSEISTDNAHVMSSGGPTAPTGARRRRAQKDVNRAREDAREEQKRKGGAK